jgi:hypothetical protein
MPMASQKNQGMATPSLLMNVEQLVIPAEAGIQSSGNPLKIGIPVFTGMTK